MGRIDLGKLAKLHGAGKTVDQMARHFGCSDRSIRRHLLKLNDRTPVAVLCEAEQVDRAVVNTMNAQEEWLRLHNEARNALDALKGAGDWPEAVRAIRVCQQSLDQFLRMAELLHDWRDAQQFQQTVLDVIGGVDVDVRQEIIRRLDEKRSLRLAIAGPAQP